MAAQQKDADLQQVQFFKDQAATACGQIRLVAGRMDRPHRLGLVGHPVTGQQFRRQRVLQLPHVGQCRLGTAGLPGCRQALGSMVDRHEGTGRHLGFGAHQRVQQFPVGQRTADPSFKIIGFAHDQLVRRVGGVEPGQRQHAGIIGGQRPAKHPSALDAPGRLLLQHGGLDAAVHIVGGRSHRVGLGIIDVFTGIAEQQVPDGADAQFFKLFGKGRAHALQILNGTVDGGHTEPPFCLGWAADRHKGKRRTRNLPKFAFCLVCLPLTPPRSCSNTPADRR